MATDMEREFLLEYAGGFYFHALGLCQDMASVNAQPLYPQKHSSSAEHQKDSVNTSTHIRLCRVSVSLLSNWTSVVQSHTKIQWLQKKFHFYKLECPHAKSVAHTVCVLSFSKLYRENTLQRLGLVSLPRRYTARIQLNMNMKTNCFGCQHPHCSGK